ncbi:hypothetical protein N9Y59_00065 [Planktomarina temperata]|nr:hypothetical protein [Planktomarina temperata]
MLNKIVYLRDPHSSEPIIFNSNELYTKRILLTTTSLVLAAGVAQAEVTFSGTMEAGVSRTSKVDAVAGRHATAAVDGDAAGTAAVSDTNAGHTAAHTADANTDIIGFVNGVLTTTKRTGTMTTIAADATTGAEAANSVGKQASVVALAKQAVVLAEAALAGDSTPTQAELDNATSALATAKAKLALEEAILASYKGTAAVKEGDMVAYSGYDMEVAVSSTLDNGMVVSAGFDMGAGSIADRDDDRVLDAQGAAVALSAVTIKNGGVTYVIGQDKIDDLYDDTQNGDVSVSGAMGGISYTLVADLDKDVAKKDATFTVESGTAGNADFKAAAYSAAVAAVHESTSLKLSGSAAGVDWSFTTTNKDDFGDAASLVTLGYAAGDALSFTLKHDTDGAAEAINTLSATYTMDAISLTASMADDKNHARNTNKNKKASQNMTIAYANGPLTASFNNDESSAWWATTSYDLGNGADIFATVDHTEFAVVGLTFAF